MLFEMPQCGGCRTCEMACSIRDGQDFSPSRSCIKIVESGYGYKVDLYMPPDGEENACLICLSKGKEPLCVQFCNKAHDLMEILSQYANIAEQQ